MKLLVTGGAGYIGSHAVKRLLADGHDVHVLDNLSRGHRDALPPEANLWEMDLLDTTGITTALKQHGVEAVMNFAALAYVGESVEQPLLYYRNNTAGVLSLLEAMDRAGVTRLVHSSTCATYGEPAEMPITEDMPQNPINPYGWSKLFVERILADYAAAKRLAGDNFAYAALRYFNVAGSAPTLPSGRTTSPRRTLSPSSSTPSSASGTTSPSSAPTTPHPTAPASATTSTSKTSSTPTSPSSTPYNPATSGSTTSAPATGCPSSRSSTPSATSPAATSPSRPATAAPATPPPSTPTRRKSSVNSAGPRRSPTSSPWSPTRGAGSSSTRTGTLTELPCLAGHAQRPVVDHRISRSGTLRVTR